MSEINNIIVEISNTNPYKVVLSDKSNKEYEYKKIVISKKIIKSKQMYQIESFTEKQAFHSNIEIEELEATLINLINNYKQINSFSLDKEMDVKVSKKGKVLVNRRNVSGKQITIEANNKKKKYILEEGMIIPPLIDLGVFTKEGKVVNSKYDKYKQINRFIEMVDDVLKNYQSDTLNIIDFGCGKSYLTFILYYYIVEVKKLKANIVGLDLKEDVIDKCNDIANKYKYENLTFKLGDINGYKTDMPVDMVITLHACDTATDYALYNAIKWKAKIILSVPCCQHEVNSQISSEKLSLITKYGIIKERVSALITDAIRGNVLESQGYKTNLLEFIDIEQSPKNILIRAIRGDVSSDRKLKALQEIDKLCEEFDIEPTLIKLIKENNL